MAEQVWSNISAAELYWHDWVAEFTGERRECNMAVPADVAYDESIQIDTYCKAAQEMLGPEITSGLGDSVGVMKYIVGAAPLPDANKDWPDGGAPALVTA